MTPTSKRLADLHALHDKAVIIPNRIRAAIAALAKSGDDWAYEKEFVALTKPSISNVDIAKSRDAFTDFWAALPTTRQSSTHRVWFATKKLADKWKETQGV
jgi:hypothetical protein